MLAASLLVGGAAQAATCPISAFGGARILLARVPAAERDLAGARPEGVERWVAFERVVAAILGGDGQDGDLAARRAFVAALEGGSPEDVPCSAGAVARDRLVSRLAMVGYSATDIARMFYREASRARIDNDYTRRMAGYPAESPAIDTAMSEQPVPAAPIAAVVPAPIKHLPAARPPAPPGRVRPQVMDVTAAVSHADPEALDTHIRHYARAYQVDHRLVYAMIRHESNWDASVISPKGAIGLMQLMPATAAMLKVDPQDPVDNVRGGIAYLADLLRTFGSVRHALIAYNAGPTHANQVLRGERALFDETRRYLQAIAAVYPLD
ncbi:MAG: lytic transglycosylase domain-containing protein [Vicinamibacterales bacterium]|nr:lytic transglycosylase domain-containing protein [Vicinamibacterales bacterium]